MATQKIGLTKLGLKKNTSLINFTWNDQTIEIKEYLPIEEKLNLVDKIVNASIDESNFANPARVQINTILEVIFAYAVNINFTEKQKEDRLGLYDLLVGSGFADEFFEALRNTDEVRFINSTVREVIDEIYRYRDSALGILDAVNQDYSNLNLEADNIQQKLADPENLTLLKDVITKLG